jgi:hypothetical protein
MWKQLEDALADVAPTIAGILGGPLASAGVNIICDVLGIDKTAPADPAVAAAVKAATPADLAALKKADDDFAVQMRQVSLQFVQAGDADRENARQMHEQMPKDFSQTCLASAIVLSFVGLMVVMTFMPIPVANSQALSIMTGSAASAFIAVVSYYFGSSRGSQAKTAMLWQSTPVTSAAKLPIKT